jgi:hypothetical protein
LPEGQHQSSSSHRGAARVGDSYTLDVTSPSQLNNKGMQELAGSIGRSANQRFLEASEAGPHNGPLTFVPVTYA